MNRPIAGRVLAIIFLGTLSFIVIYKAIHIPITFDESSTFGITEQPIRQVMLNLNWDNSPSNWPNNHILNTLLTKASVNIFSMAPWALRLPNILAFLLFGLAVYVLAVKYFSASPWLFMLPVVLMSTDPYVLDFFSVARGYGMGSSFMVCSIVGLLAYVSSSRMWWYYIAILLAALAAYAQFTFLLYWLALHILLVILFLTQKNLNKRRWHIALSIIIVGIIFWALWTYPLMHIQQGVRHDYPVAGGFFETTIVNSASNFLYGKPLPFLSPHMLAWIAIVTIIFGAVYCSVKVSKKALSLADPLILVSILLALVWLINMLQVYISHTTYLTHRIALIYYLLFVFVVIFLIRDIAAYHRILARASALAILLFFLVNFSRTVTLKSVYEWSYDAYTYDVVGYLRDYRQKHPESQTIEIKLGGHFYPSFFYYHYMDYKNLRWLDITTRFDTVTQPLFYYATADEEPKLIHYKPAQSFGPDGQVLMIHR
jgi:hypothetical protein